MATEQQIWTCDNERAGLWSEDPERAAMLAYLEVVNLWHDQVVEGTYTGVPALHRQPQAPVNSAGLVEFEPSTQRSRPARYTRDGAAGQYVVPDEIRRRWMVAI